MLVRCKHTSILYPEGKQNIGDIFDLPKLQAENYEKMEWVEILPKELQSEVKRGKKKKNELKGPTDLSKSPLVGRYLEHNFSHKK